MKAATIAAIAVPALLLMLTVTNAARPATGSDQIMGMVQSISDQSLAIGTPDKGTVNVYLDAETKFLRDEKPSSLKALKQGEHVLVEVESHDGHLLAKVVKAGKFEMPPME